MQERRGESSRVNYGRRYLEDFNLFINHMELQDIPIQGKRFTWFQPNGKFMSRLDRFLLSHDWLLQWPDSSQQVLDREFSDHCPVLLRCSVKDWGPKPFKTLNCWHLDPRFKDFVEKAWG